MFVWVFEPKKSEVEQRPVEQVVPHGAFPWGSAVVIALVTFFASMLYYVFIINGSLAFTEVGVTEPERYAKMIFIPQLFILVGAGLFKALANRSYRFQLGVFLTLMGAGLAGMGLATSPNAMVASLIVQQTAAGMAVPTLLAWTQSRFDFAHRGRGMGIWTAAFFLGQSQSPRLVHVIDQSTGSMQGAFLTAGVVGLAGGAIALIAALAFRKPSEATA
jgi:sugar phosphate permease